MPKANKTILDRLNKILKTRQDALNRLDRRASTRPWGINESRAWTESENLVRDLDDAAALEYNSIMYDKPGRRIERKAIKMMPGHLVPEGDWQKTW